MLKFSILFLTLVAFSVLHAADFNERDAKRIIKDKSGSIKFVFLKPETNIEVANSQTWLKSLLSAPNTCTFKLDKTERDKLGFKHYRYLQYHNGKLVENGVYYVHTRYGKIISANGEYYSNISVPTSSNLSSLRATQIAKQTVKKNTGAWHEDVDKPKIVIIKNGNNYGLAYKVDIYSVEPLTRKYVYVNASTGKVLKEIDRICHTDVIGTAATKYSGSRSITADSVSATSYRLRQSGRGNGINTYDLNNGTVYSSAVDFTDSDNVWNTTTNQDDAAYDAHFGAEATYDYFFNIFGRDSYDNSGAAINSYIHYGTNYVNAFWDGSRMTYGDGDGVSTTALTSLDIVAHEITHAITENTANLVYSYESGALNESFSDIFGVVLDFEENPTTANYLMGDQIYVSGTAFRSMANPNLYGDPDTYLGTNWHTSPANNGGVHTNSGVQNYWFYLLVNGGTGINDNGDSFSVSGIGMLNASKIAYRNLSVYLTANSNYNDARTYAIQSAEDLFGTCSPEAIATTNAWHAVGVGAVYANGIAASFLASQNHSCTLTDSISFINSSLNASAYHWNFGDGDTSNLENPVHLFDSLGTFTVTLIVSDTSSCAGTDTLVLTNYITIDTAGALTAASCMPSTTNAGSFGRGIFGVNFNTITSTSAGGTEGYQDYSCTNSTTVTEGSTYPITITTGTNGSEDVKIWIDLNDDGIFNATTELVYFSDNVLTTHSGNLTIPAGTVFNTPLRMRIGSDYFSNVLTPCTNSVNGQFEDYSITIIQSIIPPSTDFVANNLVISSGSTINFTDLTQHLPTSWEWEFTGASVVTSTLQNPSATYPTVGNFDVKLKTTNSFGSDSLTKLAYISVIDQFNMCSADSSNGTSGQLFDSGGPTGNYSNNQNCSFLINPGCAQSITLTFSSFQLEGCCDFFRVYDGTDATGTLLLTANGSSLPGPVTANSGSMFITFSSDFSVVLAGWDASWTSVVPSTMPTASFAVSNNNVLFNSPVQFTDQSTNFPGTWDWNFGDGNSSTSQNPSHTYTSSGVYQVQLIVGNCFSSDTIVDTVTVQGPPNMVITPIPLTGTVNCGDSVTVPLLITNTGAGDLVLNMPANASSSSFGTPEILALTYGVDLSLEYPNTIAALDEFNTSYNLTATGTTDSLVLQTALMGKDILLVPENETGAQFVFSNLANTVQTFVNGGGTVIFCGSANAPSNPVFGFDLFDGSYLGTASVGSGLTLDDPTHPLADSVVVPLVGVDATFRYDFVNANVNTIVSQNGNSIVAHRDYGQGKVILVGYDYFQLQPNSSRILGNAVNWSFDGQQSWLQNQQVNDTLATADSLTLMVTLNAANLIAGVYYDTLEVMSNDSANTISYVPVQFTINGSPLINVAPALLNYGTMQVGAVALDSVIISNDGCDSLDISALLFSSADFSTTSSGIFQIPPFSSTSVPITFSPSAIANYTDTLYIQNSDTLKYVLLNAISVGAPILTYSPTQIDTISFGCNDSVVVPITIYNTGLGVLNLGQSLALSNISAGYFFDGFESGNFNNWTVNNTANTYSITSVNPATGSNSLSIVGSSSQGLEYVFTPDTVKYFSAKLRSDDLSGASNYLYLGNSQSNFGICAVSHLGTNQYRFQGSTTFTYTTAAAGDWMHFELKNIDYTTKQYDVYVNGALQFANMGFNNSFTSNMSEVNLFNFDGVNAGYYDDIRIGYQAEPEWIVISADSLNVPINDSITFNVTLYSDSLLSGNYTSSILLNSNDPLLPFDTIPVFFTVDGDPEINFSQACINFPSIQENTSILDSFLIHNSGCDTLFLSSLAVGGSPFSVINSPPFVLPKDSLHVYVLFSPTTLGTYNDTLTVINNATDSMLCLTGIAVGAPIISVNPDTLNIFVDCNDSLLVPLTIYNTGAGALNYNLFGSGLGNGFDSTSFQNFFTTGASTTHTFTGQFSGADSVELEITTNGDFDSSFEFATFSIEGGAPTTIIDNDVSISTNIVNSYFYGGIDVQNWLADNIFSITLNNSASVNLFGQSFHQVRLLVDGVPWLTLMSPDSAGVAVGDSTIVNYLANGVGLDAGVYSTTASIGSNDPINPVLTVPVNLTVTGSPNISFNSSCVNFGSVFQNGTVNDSLMLYNNGCDTLFINNTISNLPDFTFSTNSSFILPDDSTLLQLSFSPTSIGTVNDTLQIFNNDADTTLCLVGVSTAPPIISVNPTAVNLTLPFCDTNDVSFPFTIFNTGGSNLHLGAGSLELDTVLARLNDNFGSITSLVPSIHNFSEGVVGNSINDGGGDMYDGGNRLNTNIQSAISYSDNLVIQSPFMGSTGAYFTRKNTGLFVFAADLDNVSNFSITGNLGADGSGSSDGTVLTSSVGGVNYQGFVSRIFNAGDPSINHIVITEQSVGATHTFLPTTGNENHQISNLNSSTRIYYLLYSSLGGSYIDNSQTQSIMDQFLTVITSGGGAASDTIAPADSLIVTLNFNSADYTPGVPNNSNYAIYSNDPLNPILNLPITVTVLDEPCVDFSDSIVAGCSGLVYFDDESENDPTSWQWNFGDGNMATVQNPSHYYTSAGTYAVTLIGCKNGICDTATTSVFIPFVSGLAAPACLPASNSSSVNYGITYVDFNTIINSSGASVNGYQDFTCDYTTTVNINQTVNLVIQTASANSKSVRVWMDFDNNGLFTGSELVVNLVNSFSPHNANITIPNTAVLGVPLRMRVATDLASNPSPLSCSMLSNGEFEDYLFEVGPDNSAPPEANYNTAMVDTCTGTIQFTDVSTNNPTSWAWNFGDNGSSSLQNPIHTYTVSGTYNVSLVASNTAGLSQHIAQVVVNLPYTEIVTGPLSVGSPINFTSITQNGSNWNWNFGDNSSSTQESPSHTYSNSGTYIVTFSAIDEFGCEVTATDTLFLDASSIPENSYKYSLFPNPNEGLFYISGLEFEFGYSISVYNAIGEVVYIKDADLGEDKTTIDLSRFESGIYFVKIASKEQEVIGIEKVIVH